MRGSWNYPMASFNNSAMKQLANKLTREKKLLVLFHCHFSQIRGPAAAEAFQKYIISHGDVHIGNNNLEIMVLRGGISAWSKHHRSLCDDIH